MYLFFTQTKAAPIIGTAWNLAANLAIEHPHVPAHRRDEELQSSKGADEKDRGEGR